MDQLSLSLQYCYFFIIIIITKFGVNIILDVTKTLLIDSLIVCSQIMKLSIKSIFLPTFCTFSIFLKPKKSLVLKF